MKQKITNWFKHVQTSAKYVPVNPENFTLYFIMLISEYLLAGIRKLRTAQGSQNTGFPSKKLKQN